MTRAALIAAHGVTVIRGVRPRRSHPGIDPLAHTAEDEHVVMHRQAEKDDEREERSQEMIEPFDVKPRIGLAH